MSRLVPFRAKAPEVVKTRIEETLASTMYLVQTTGPTSYVVRSAKLPQRLRSDVQKSRLLDRADAHALFLDSHSLDQIQEQNCEKKHKVLIGALQNCSCGDRDVCIHILFVMLKVCARCSAFANLRERAVWS